MISLIGNSLRKHIIGQGISGVRADTKLTLADGTSSDIDLAFEFSLTLGGNKSHKVKALFLPNLTVPMVLGMDVITDLGILQIKGVAPKPNTDNCETLCQAGVICKAKKDYASSSSLLNVVLPNDKTENRTAITTQPDLAEYNKVDDVVTCQSNAISALNESEEAILKRFLDDELQRFNEIRGRTTLVEHKIRLKDDNPIKQRYYPRNPAMQTILNEEVRKMLADDVIERSSSPWSSPVVLVKKPSGKYRFCVDYRRVNAVSEKDAYPMHQINAILEKLRNASYISTIDLKNGYWQVPLEKDSRPITAFTVPGLGLFHFKVMPFGLHTAPATFQRLLDTIIGPEFEPNAFAYLDDLVVVSKTFSEHLQLLKEVFNRLRHAGLILNPDKCHFCKKQLKYLGHVINEKGIHTDPDKIRAIQEFPTPKNVRQIRSFLGLSSWYRRFVPNYAQKSSSLTKLLRKHQRWEWKESQEKAFKRLKDSLTTAPILTCPDFNIPFVVQVDASQNGLGASLTQNIDRSERVIAYASRLLSDREQNFSVTEKECLALVWAVKKFRPYLEGYSFTAITDHQALRWLMTLEKPTGRLARWVLELQQFQFTVQYRKGTLNRVADALSRNPATDTSTINSGDPECLVTVNKPELTTAKKASLQDNPVNDNLESDWHAKKLNQVIQRPTYFKNYEVRGESLYRKFNIRKQTADTTLQWKLCVPKEQVKTVLYENHDSPTAGHLGIHKTISKIQDRYYWPGWRKDVKNYVRCCDKCQRHKVEQKKAYGKMYFRKPVGPWFKVTSDIMGPLPRTRKGNRYVIVFQDTFTKWVELAPLKSATAHSVANKLVDLVLLRHGTPEVLLTDNGTQYVSRIFTKLADEWGFSHEFTAPYSPQANPTERANRVIKTMISQYVADDHRSWDLYLDEFRFALNTTIQESTNFTAAMLNYGRELKVPKCTYGPLMEERENRQETITELHNERLRKLLKLRETCKSNLETAFKRQAKYYNLRRRESPFREGQLVLRRSHTLSSAVDYIAGKLAPKFDGPYIVQERIGANIYQLKDQNGKSVGRSHAKDLKHYLKSDKLA